MAITDSQKVDYLYKKIGAGVAKTDTSAYKSPSNEANASPLLTRGDTIWQQSVQIPATIPVGNTSVVVLYQDSLSSTIQANLDTTVSGTNRTWLTNQVDWIGPEFGATYQVKVYAAPAGNSAPQTYGTQLFSDGSGNADSWFFDYQAGILNFPDTNVPSALTGKTIYITGARYVGQKGLTNFPSGATFGNLTLSGNNITSSSGNVTIVGNLNVAGNTTFYGYSDLTITDSILNLHTQANLAPWTFNDGKDIGIKMHYYDGQDSHAALVRANDSGYLEWYSRGLEVSGNVFQGNAYGVIKTGELILANTTPATGPNTGALQVWGGASISGNLYIGNLQADLSIFAAINDTPIGNSIPSTGAFTYLHATTGFSTANAVITGGYADNYPIGANLASTGRFTTLVTTDVATIGGNLVANSGTASTTIDTGALVVIGGAGISGNLNVGETLTTNVVATPDLQATSGNVATLYAQNFSSPNAVISGGYISALANATISYGNIQTAYIQNLSSGNAVISGGYITSLANVSASLATFDNLTVNSNTTTANLTANSIASNNYVVTNYGNITGANVVSANTFIASGVILENANIGNLVVANTVQFGNLRIGGNSITNVVGTDILFVSNAGIVNFDMVTAMRLPSGDDADRPDNAVSGMIRYNTSLLTIEWYNGTQWMPLSNAITQQDFDGDGTTATFALSYPATDDSIIVNINGTMQFPGIAYSVVGTDIVFVEAPQLGDHIDIRFIGVPLLNVLSNGGGGNTTIITGNTYIPPQALGPGDNPTFAGIQVTGNANIGNVRASGFYWSNGAPFVGLNPYSNANVTAYLTSAASSVTANLANVIVSQGIYWANGQPYSSGSTYSNANVASYLTSGATGIKANLGNVVTSQGIYWANGQPYSSGTTYSNSNVASYLTQVSGNIIPAANVQYYLGNETNWWKSLYVSSETIFIGGKPLTANTRTNVVTYNNTIIGGPKFSRSTTPPASSLPGEFWYDTETDVLYKYIQDEDSVQWVDVTGPFGVAGVQGIQGPPGADGADGADGNDGTSVIILGSVADFASLPVWGNLSYGDGFIIQATGNLAVYDGSNFQDVGQIKGPKGDTGDIGIGVESAAVTNGNLLITLSNTYVINAGNVTGPQGAQGEQGIQGNVGPQGEQGIQGNVGPAGTTYINFGNAIVSSNIGLDSDILRFAGYNGVVIGISANTANIGLSGNVELHSVTARFAEPLITGNVPGNYTPDWNTGAIHNYVARQNFTLNPPVNMPIGAAMTIVVTQDETGNRTMTPNAYYKFASNIRTLSTGANSVDMMNFVRTSSNTYLTVLTKGYA